MRGVALGSKVIVVLIRRDCRGRRQQWWELIEQSSPSQMHRRRWSSSFDWQSSRSNQSVGACWLHPACGSIASGWSSTYRQYDCQSSSADDQPEIHRWLLVIGTMLLLTARSGLLPRLPSIHPATEWPQLCSFPSEQLYVNPSSLANPAPVLKSTLRRTSTTAVNCGLHCLESRSRKIISSNLR